MERRAGLGRVTGPADDAGSLFAAFNMTDGTVISELHRRHRAIEFRKFQARIDKGVPDGLDCVPPAESSNSNSRSHEPPAAIGR